MGLPTPAGAQTPSPVAVAVDATTPGPPIERVWAFHGYDEINYTTDPEGLALLGRLSAAHTATPYVRSHFLFNTGDGTPGLKWGSTNVYTEDAAGTPVYDWAITDGIMDALTAAGALPLVELGFMPQALSTRPLPYRNSASSMLDGGSLYPPRDHARWADLVRTWAGHAAARYLGVESTWLWELWNEPDLGYWKGTDDDYATLYDHTEAALHQVLPAARLGGPAVAFVGNGFLRAFLEHCAAGTNAVTGATGTRLDLVSFHAKGGVTSSGSTIQMNLGNQLRLHRLGFRTVAGFPPFRQTPIYITEADPDGCAACPIADFASNAYRNSPAYGAYELSMMKHTLELAALEGVALRGVLTWAFTFPGTPYFAGYRALATNGIDLPVMGAFQLLGRLSGARLALTSSGALLLDDVVAGGVHGAAELDGMATVDQGTIRVLLWSYHDQLATAAATPVQVTVAVPDGFGPNARVSHLRVDDTHGNAHAVWVAAGQPAQPGPELVQAMRAAMAPAPVGPERVLAIAAGRTVTMTFDLPRFGISLLTLVASADALDGGAHEDGGATPDAGAPRVGGGGCRCTIPRADGGGTGLGERVARGGAFCLAAGLLLAARSRPRRR